ncbi:hypothetical protein R0J89_16660, partial [Psychrobacter sp. SIMBA_152]
QSSSHSSPPAVQTRHALPGNPRRCVSALPASAVLPSSSLGSARYRRSRFGATPAVGLAE